MDAVGARPRFMMPAKREEEEEEEDRRERDAV